MNTDSEFPSETIEARSEMSATTPQEIERINANVKRAVDSGEFVIITVWVDASPPKKIIRVARATSGGFPRADFPNAVQMIADSFLDEIKRGPPARPNSDNRQIEAGAGYVDAPPGWGPVTPRNEP